MAYFGKKSRRLGEVTFTGESVSGLPNLSLANTSPDFLGTLSNATTDVENFLYNAGTGNLTASQIAEIKTNGNKSIAQAAAGNPALTQAQQSQWQQDLTSVINQGYYGGSGNILADLGLDSNASAGAGSTGIVAWLESNWAYLFVGVAAFLIFRPDKAF
jgi:autotransporter adhesin